MSKVILSTVPWVLMAPPEGRRGPGADILCTRCKRRDPLPTPLPIRAMPWFVRAFQELHRLCEVKA